MTNFAGVHLTQLPALELTISPAFLQTHLPHLKLKPTFSTGLSGDFAK